MLRATELFTNLNSWAKDNVVSLRIDNAESGYSWCFNALKWPKDQSVGLKECQDFFNRDELNAEYERRYNEQDFSKRKPFAWYQNEINLIYSFHKCFAMRYHSRLQFYRHDLSQKGVRNFSSVRKGLAQLLFKRDLSEKIA